MTLPFLLLSVCRMDKVTQFNFSESLASVWLGAGKCYNSAKETVQSCWNNRKIYVKKAEVFVKKCWSKTGDYAESTRKFIEEVATESFNGAKILCGKMKNWAKNDFMAEISNKNFPKISEDNSRYFFLLSAAVGGVSAICSVFSLGVVSSVALALGAATGVSYGSYKISEK